MRVLVVNSGSSSLKLRLLDANDQTLASEDLPGSAAAASGPLKEALAAMPSIEAVGHRIVHGGERFHEAVRIDPGVVRSLRDLVPLAPLHQERSLSALAAVHSSIPDVPAVACFDTGFHTSLPAAAATYAVPEAWRERLGLRRYGFHGLSHAYAARRAADLLGRAADRLRVVSCHLGSGASLAAVSGGISVDTTMGFTPLEGLVMATRSGSVDPGLVLWLLEQGHAGEAELAQALEHESGLLALAGTADMAEVVSGRDAGLDAARLAFDVYVHRLRAGIAAMCAAMDGADALVFTGGVGENAPAVRGAAAAGLRFLGAELSEERNEAARGADEDVSAPGAELRTLVVAAREDLEIARQVRETLAPPRDGGG